MDRYIGFMNAQKQERGPRLVFGEHLISHI
jgi:hypothetical protein